MPKMDDSVAKVDETLDKDGSVEIADRGDELESDTFQQFLSAEFGDKADAEDTDDLPPELETQDTETKDEKEEVVEEEIEEEVKETPAKAKPAAETKETKEPEKKSDAVDMPTTVEGWKAYHEERVKNLREELNRRSVESTKPGEAQTEKTVQKPTSLPFIKTDEELEAVLDSPAKYNKHLTQVYSKVMEDVMGILPGMINPLVTHYVSVSRAATAFFTENQDLLPYRDYVGDTVNEVRAELPEAPFEQVMGEVEKRVRTRLALPRPVLATTQAASPGPSQQKTRAANPGLPSARGTNARSGKPSNSTLSTDSQSIMQRILNS